MARITAQGSVLTVSDMPAALAFWTGKLGFAVVETFGEPVGFAILNRQGARVMLGLARSGTESSWARSRRAGLMDLYFWVDDAAALHAQLVAKGAAIAAPLERQFYGVLEFMVEDQDGHHVGFGQVLDAAA